MHIYQYKSILSSLRFIMQQIACTFAREEDANEMKIACVLNYSLYLTEYPSRLYSNKIYVVRTKVRPIHHSWQTTHVLVLAFPTGSIILLYIQSWHPVRFLCKFKTLLISSFYVAMKYHLIMKILSDKWLKEFRWLIVVRSLTDYIFIHHYTI